MSLDFSKKSDQLFLDLINSKSTRALSFQDIAIGAPALNDDAGKPKNTKTELTVLDTATNIKPGTAFFYHDRLDLTQLFASAEITVLLTDDITSTLDVAKVLNARYGLGISELDIEDIAIDPVANPESVVLKALEGSFVYTGEVTVPFTQDADKLEELLGDALADGFTKPELKAELLNVEVVPNASSQHTKPDGSLVIGSGNPAGSLVVASNSEIELALGARIARDLNLIDPSASHYALSVPDDNYWIFPVAVGIPEGNKVTDLYNVTLDVYSGVNDENHKQWSLELQGEQQNWVDHSEAGESITDNAEDKAGAVVQNIQALHFYPELVVGQQTNTKGGVLGHARLVLRAQRKDTLAPAVVAEITVDASAA